MTQISFNTLYYSACKNIKQVEIQLKKIAKERMNADLNRLRTLDKKEHDLITQELPRLRRIAFNLRKSNYTLFLSYMA